MKNSKEPCTLNTSAAELLKEFQSQQIEVLRIPNSRLVDLWQPPPALIYKLNFDGAIFSNNHSSGFGATNRNERGEKSWQLSMQKVPMWVMLKKWKYFPYEGCALCNWAGFRDLILEGDSINVMGKLSIPEMDCSRPGHILQEIKMLVAGLCNGFFSCYRRSDNSVAHSLVKFAKSISNWLCNLDRRFPPPAIEALSFYVNVPLLWMIVIFPLQ